MTTYIDGVLDKGKGADYDYLDSIFGIKGIDQGDFMFYIADIFTIGV